MLSRPNCASCSEGYGPHKFTGHGQRAPRGSAIVAGIAGVARKTQDAASIAQETTCEKLAQPRDFAGLGRLAMKASIPAVRTSSIML